MLRNCFQHADLYPGQSRWACCLEGMADDRGETHRLYQWPQYVTENAVMALHYSLIADYIRAQELPPELAA